MPTGSILTHPRAKAEFSVSDSRPTGAILVCWHGHALSIVDDWKTPFGEVVNEFGKELMNSMARGNIILCPLPMRNGTGNLVSCPRLTTLASHHLYFRLDLCGCICLSVPTFPLSSRHVVTCYPGIVVPFCLRAFGAEARPNKHKGSTVSVLGAMGALSES